MIAYQRSFFGDDKPEVALVPGTPIPSEETTLMDLRSAWDAVGPCYAGPKYDGFRIQIHKDGDRIWLFSRNLEDWTRRYPDIVRAMKHYRGFSQIIFDTEMVAIHSTTGKVLPREYVSRRGYPRKAIVFDLLYLDGKEWMSRPFYCRQPAIAPILSSSNDTSLAPSDDRYIETFEELTIFYDTCVAADFEGIVIKSPHALYHPGIKSPKRIKVKRTDTIDCVILGFDCKSKEIEHTSITSFLVGIYHAEERVFLGVAKVRGGLPQRDWELLCSKMSKLQMNERPTYVHTGEKPDMWVKPIVVMEVDGTARRPSNKYLAGLEQTGTGYELREARFSKRGWRKDKGPEDATTLAEFLRIPLAPGHEDQTAQLEIENEKRVQQLKLL
jgi:DNA ligase-1